MSFLYGALIGSSSQSLDLEIFDATDSTLISSFAAFDLFPSSDLASFLELFETSFVATSHSTLLRFTDISASTSGTDGILDNINVVAQINAVPEPASVTLLGPGLLGLAFSRRKTIGRLNS